MGMRIWSNEDHDASTMIPQQYTTHTYNTTQIVQDDDEFTTTTNEGIREGS
jgi:hypothetical protein